MKTIEKILYLFFATLILFAVFLPEAVSLFWRCPIKYITGIPCPGCGTTRAIRHLVHGEIGLAFYTNPLGLFAAFILLILVLGKLFLKEDKQRSIIDKINNFINEHVGFKWALILLAIVLASLNCYWNMLKGN